MYKIIKTDGVLVGYTSKPRYIKKAANGCYVESDPADAVGIAYHSVAYNLLGHDDVDGASSVLLIEGDGGDITGTHEVRLTTAESATTEIDKTYDRRIKLLENALCEVEKGV